MSQILSLEPDEKLLETLANDEEKMRRSEWYLSECNRVANIPNGWMDVTEQGQQTVIAKHIPEQTLAELYIHWLRRAHHLFPDNQVFQNRLQVKFNRARKGELKVGDPVPEIVHRKLGDGVNMFIGSSQT